MNTQKSEEKEEMKTKVIFNPSIARQLLHKGHTIIDIKPSKDNRKETWFVFNCTEQFNNDLIEILGLK